MNANNSTTFFDAKRKVLVMGGSDPACFQADILALLRSISTPPDVSSCAPYKKKS